jgi:hypothetical protein
MKSAQQLVPKYPSKIAGDSPRTGTGSTTRTNWIGASAADCAHALRVDRTGRALYLGNLKVGVGRSKLGSSSLRSCALPHAAQRISPWALHFVEVCCRLIGGLCDVCAKRLAFRGVRPAGSPTAVNSTVAPAVLLIYLTRR